MYYFSRNSRRKIVHSFDCFQIGRVDVECVDSFESLEQARKNGYRQCRCCNTLIKQYRKEALALTRFGKGRGFSFRVDDRFVHIDAPRSRWKILRAEGNGRLVLLHENEYQPLRDVGGVLPGYHVQNVSENSILAYAKYIAKHEKYRKTHPVHTSPSKPPARKGTKRYKKQKKAEKLQAKRRAVTNVLRLIEQVSSQAG